jgi:hypothetical protein
MLTPPRKERMREAFADALQYLETLPTSTPCSECIHWVTNYGSCGKWGAVPPPEARATGCESWEEGIPF